MTSNLNFSASTFGGGKQSIGPSPGGSRTSRPMARVINSRRIRADLVCCARWRFADPTCAAPTCAS